MKKLTKKLANARLTRKSGGSLTDAITEIRPWEKREFQYGDSVVYESKKGWMTTSSEGEFPWDSYKVIEFHHIDGRYGSFRFATEINFSGDVLPVDIFKAQVLRHLFRADYVVKRCKEVLVAVPENRRDRRVTAGRIPYCRVPEGPREPLFTGYNEGRVGRA